MERALTPASLEEVRALIAREWLGAAAAPERVGAIALRPHQREAVRRLRAALQEFGGALLADAVGLGKTYVAAALIRDAGRAVVVCPAALREMWQRALRTADARAEIITYSALSLGREPRERAPLLVLDEAHHARTPSALRYATLARIAVGARVLALTATPIHNSRDDLAALLALFLGARAWVMSDAEIARCVVRREAADVAGTLLPALEPPRWLDVGDDGELLRAIVALPPPLPPAGGGDGGALVAWGLARQWASSRAALEGAVRRRLARAIALRMALEEGHYPTSRELSAWVCTDDAVQLAFPALMSSPGEGIGALLDALRLHEAGLRALTSLVKSGPGADLARAEQMRALRRAHPGERIVAFSQFADTVHALYRALARDGGVAALSARGARVAGGALSRRDALARFAPRAVGAAPPAAAERIEVLLATDLVSEGLDLGDASVVVHLDLPWTPARLEQRVGRSRRMGAPHARTAVYAMAPPAAAEALLEVERRLREKLAAAGRITGVVGAILPSLGPPSCIEPSAARAREMLHHLVASWRRDGAEGDARPRVAAVYGDRYASLLLTRLDGRTVLAASHDGGAISDDPELVLAVAELVARARLAPLDTGTLSRTLAQVDRWLERRRGAAAVGGAPLFRAAARRNALRRIARITSRMAHHRRAVIVPLAATARRVVTTPFGVGAEQVLGVLADAPLADEAWLRALSEFGAIHADGRADAEPPGAAGVLALVIVAPTVGSS